MKYKPYPKCDAVKNYFPRPNEIFSLGLASGEIAVYSYLLYREDRKTFQCWPSYKTIGRAVGLSRNTVRKYVSGLEERGLIRTEPTKIYTRDGRTRNGNLLYTVRPIREAVDKYNERQMQKADEDIARWKAAKALEQSGLRGTEDEAG